MHASLLATALVLGASAQLLAPDTLAQGLTWVFAAAAAITAAAVLRRCARAATGAMSPRKRSNMGTGTPLGLDAAPAAAVATLHELLHEGYAQYRQDLFSAMDYTAAEGSEGVAEGAADFRPPDDDFNTTATLDDLRIQALRRLQCVSNSGLMDVNHLDTAPLKFYAAHEAVGTMDGSVGTRLTVQFNLFGGTLLRLGSEKHKVLVDGVNDLSVMGCFALTERATGNNAVEMKTTAVYDPDTETFEINTPVDEGGAKIWITNGALWASQAIVFAQLHVGEEHHGVHAFVVPLRDADTGEVLEGVRVHDMGLKLGCNGVDNAEIRLDHVTVPRDALLDRYSQVAADGTFTSSIPKKRARFLKVADQLLSGRICLATESLGGAKVAMAVAIRYSAQRLGFGPTGQSDFPILGYGSQQRSLAPRLAAIYAMCVGLDHAKRCYATRDMVSHEEVIRVVCAMKSYTTWMCQELSVACRERCGGASFLEENQIARLVRESHAAITAEGDNLVLASKTTRELMLAALRGEKGGAGVAGADGSPGVFGAAVRAMCKVLPGGIRHTASFLVNAGAAKAVWAAKRAVGAGADLLTLDGLMAAYRRREQDLLAKLVLALRGVPRDELFAAWYSGIDLASAVARAYSERVIMEALLRAVERAKAAAAVEPDAALAVPAMERIATLWGLWRIEEGLRYFVISGVVAACDVPRVAEEVTRLSSAVAQDGVAYCDAFGLPPHVLSAPIAQDNYLEFQQLKQAAADAAALEAEGGDGDAAEA